MVSFIKKYKWYLIILIVIGLVGGGYFFYYQKKNSPTQPIAKGEKAYSVRKEILENNLSLSGSIDAEEKVTLRFQTSGMLTWVGVKEGDYVKKYQGLASLDTREVQKNLQKYLNTFSKIRSDLDQQRDDYDGMAMTDEMKRILEKNQYDVNNAVLDVELKDIALKYSYLYTPIEGLVVSVGAPYAGVNITPSQAEFVVVNPKTIYFMATADQTDVVSLKEGMVGNIVLDSYPDDKVKSEITKIYFTPKSGETGTVYEVKMILSNNKNISQYRLGMTGDVEFALTNTKGTLVVPSSYITTENEEKFVYKLKNGNKVKTKIKTGEIIDSKTEIISGLKEGDIIYD